MACATCGAEQQPGARFCFACGAQQGETRCATCGSPLVAAAKFCSECGTPVGAPAQEPNGLTRHPVASRRVTSVLFGDLVSFTTLSEQRDQEEVRELLTRYFDECRRVVARYGGTVEKFIGDAVMAVWGAPTAHEDDAERSVRAGLDLVSHVAALGAEVGAAGLRMRVGVVTGEVAVTVGAEQQGMVAGDPVNTASRVQGVARPGQVWVDETTRQLTSSAISYHDEGAHALKGKAEPVALWSARAVTASVRGIHRSDELEAPLVGRDRELRLLKELFHGVEDSGRPGLVLVDGDAGLGKSRLAWELEKYLDGLQVKVGWLIGRCAAYGDGVAFQPLADAVRGRLQALAAPDDALVETADGTADAATDGDRLLAALAGLALDDEERAWLRPRVAVLLGAGAGGRPDPDEGFAREDLFAAWTTVLERVGRGRNPVVWVVDDAQHADESFLQFVDHLLGAAAFPLLVVLLSRPGLLDEHPWLVARPRATVLRLGPLETPDMTALVDALVGGLPVAARDRLVSRSDGVPLFAVETIRSLVSRGLVVRRDGAYVVTDRAGVAADALAAPHSLQALVRARLDLLTPDQRTVVDRASVLGNAFTRSVIAALCEDVTDVDAVLAELVRLEVLRRDLRRTSPDFGRYRFAQTVAAQVARATLSRHDRKATHLAAARQLEGEDAAGDLAPVIASHLEDAIAAVPDADDVDELVGRLVAHLERAAERLRTMGAPGEAAGHLRTALRHVTDQRARADLLRRLSWALVDAGRFAEVLEPAAEAVGSFDGWGDDLAAASAAAARAQALTSIGENEAALALLAPRWEALRDSGDEVDVLLALASAVSRARMRLGLDARDVLEARLRLADLAGDHEATADTILSLGVHYLAIGAVTLVDALLAAAVSLSREHHLTRTLGRALTNYTGFAVIEDLGRADTLGREAVVVATRSGMQLMRDYASLNLAMARFARGDWVGLREDLGDPELAVDASNLPIRTAFTIQLDLATGEPGRLPWTRGERVTVDHPGAQAWQDLCEALLSREEGDAEASALAVRAVEGLSAITGLAEDLSMMWPVAAEVVIGAGDDAALARILRLTEEAGQRVPGALVAHRRWAEGTHAARTGRPADAEPLLRDAVTRYDAWGSPVYAALARATLSGVVAGQGRDQEAAVLAQQAREVLGRIGATAWLRRLDG